MLSLTEPLSPPLQGANCTRPAEWMRFTPIDRAERGTIRRGQTLEVVGAEAHRRGALADPTSYLPRWQRGRPWDLA